MKFVVCAIHYLGVIAFGIGVGNMLEYGVNTENTLLAIVSILLALGGAVSLALEFNPSDHNDHSNNPYIEDENVESNNEVEKDD